MSRAPCAQPSKNTTRVEEHMDGNLYDSGCNKSDMSGQNLVPVLGQAPRSNHDAGCMIVGQSGAAICNRSAVSSIKQHTGG